MWFESLGTERNLYWYSFTEITDFTSGFFPKLYTEFWETVENVNFDCHYFIIEYRGLP